MISCALRTLLPVFLRRRQQRFVILFHLRVRIENGRNGGARLIDVALRLRRRHGDQLAAVFLPGRRDAIEILDAPGRVQGFGLAALVADDGLEIGSKRFFLIYRAAMESSFRQATLGKMATGLVTTGLNGERLSFGRALGRTVLTL